MLKALAAGAALACSAAGFAQTTTTPTSTLTPAAQQVQLLAPQLVAFAGSVGNFDSLVNGLTSGAPVTLTTATADGQLQVVTFVPGSTQATLDVARQLEAARQNLISLGIATPTAQQLAVSLVGGTLPTLAGSAAVTGVIPGAASGTTPLQVRNEIATIPTSPSVSGLIGGLNLSATEFEALRNGLAQGAPVNLNGTAISPIGGTMSAVEVNQSLQLATLLLAQQGIVNPTADQIRVALLGGTLTGANGASIPIRGVLEGRVRNTSASPTVSTSASTFFGTSDTPPTTGPLPAPPAALLAPGALPPPTIPATAPTATTIGVPRANTAEGANRARSSTRPGG